MGGSTAPSSTSEPAAFRRQAEMRFPFVIRMDIILLPATDTVTGLAEAGLTGAATARTYSSPARGGPDRSHHEAGHDPCPPILGSRK